MSKYIDIPSCLQVIGAAYLNPDILDNPQYNFNTEDFPEEFHQIIFGSIYNLHSLGVEQITGSNIEDYLSTRPKKLAIYQLNKGTEFLQKLAENTQTAAFGYYYNRMKKMTLLRMYKYKLGLDLTWLYDSDNILDAKKRQQQEDWLDNTPIEEIADLIDKQILQIRSKYVSDKEDIEFVQAGTGAMELLESLQKTPDYGYPLYGNLINTVFRGARLGKFYLRSMPTNVGKAIPNDTLIPTPIGWRKVGDIRTGDYLFGQDGKPTKVLATYPQTTKKQVWEVVFADGRIARCCGEHLWEYQIKGKNGRVTKVNTTEEIYRNAQKLKNNFKDSDNRGYRYRIRLNEPVEYPEKEFSVSPYAMGALIGDGSFRYDKINKAITFSSENDEIPKYVGEEIGYIPHKNSKYNFNYSFKKSIDDKHNLWVEEIFSDYPQLWNLKSEDKFIPEDYLMGSIEQRYSLLQGLLDTDGSIDKKSACVTFCTISSKLKNDIIKLAESLGMATSVREDNRAEKYVTGVCYTVTLQCKNEIKPKLFKLKRKKEIAILHANKAQKYYKDALAIVEIRKTNDYADMTCFTVDNSDHLFLMNDYIVTHNTRTMIADAAYIACDEIYDLNKQEWVPNGTSEPTMLITTEQRVEEIQTMIWAFVSGVPEDHILENRYNAGELDRVIHAIEIIERSPLYIKELPDFSLADIELNIKTGLNNYKVKYVFLDYIHSSMKILSEISSKSKVAGLREDNVLFLIGVKLKDIAVENDVFILSSTQLNGQYVSADIPDQNLLRGAKSLGDKVDAGMIALRVTEDDKNFLVPFCEKNGFEIPTMKISVYKNRRGRYNHFYLWCTSDLSTCRVNPIFATEYDYSVITIEDTKIKVFDDKEKE
jgi:replicative DNA helicase